MQYKHFKLSIINWWKVVYLNHCFANILSLLIIMNISKKLSLPLITQWSTIVVIIASALVITHTIVMTIILIIKQGHQDQKVVSKINTTLHNEFLFKFMKINNHLSFYIINLLNIFALIFIINTYGPNYWTFAIIFWLTINTISSNIIAILVWRKSQ